MFIALHTYCKLQTISDIVCLFFLHCLPLLSVDCCVPTVWCTLHTLRSVHTIDHLHTKSLVMGSKRVVHWTSETWWEWSQIAGSHRAPPQQPTSSVVKPEGRPAASVKRDRKAVWDQVRLSHCWHKGLVTVRDEARLRQGHNDQPCQGHQCSETTLIGESQFHISTPQGIWTRILTGVLYLRLHKYLWRQAKRVSTILY